MGQQYLAAALLNHFEGLHVQSFDLPTLLGDSTRVSFLSHNTPMFILIGYSPRKRPLYSSLWKCGDTNPV